MNYLKIISFDPPDPKNGAYIELKNIKFVTLYNSIIDTYGIYKVEKDWSDIYWSPPYSYIYPTIEWEKIWKEMDYCYHGYIRNYTYSESINGPEIHFTKSKL
tara:strand:+ start:201 stop:506 length:306 start_codon:yes stop_codon:yes gene_type:complete